MIVLERLNSNPQMKQSYISQLLKQLTNMTVLLFPSNVPEYCVVRFPIQSAIGVQVIKSLPLEETVYEISNAGQLYWFAGLVNGTLDGVEQNTLATAHTAHMIIPFEIGINDSNIFYVAIGF